MLTRIIIIINEIAEKLLLREKRFCRTIRDNRGIPKSLPNSSKGQKGGVLLHIWTDNMEGRIISTAMAQSERSTTNFEKE
jgi:hypothetical protein